MAADFVLVQQVDDVDRYRDEVIPGVRPPLRKHGADVLVTGFEAEPVRAPARSPSSDLRGRRRQQAGRRGVRIPRAHATASTPPRRKLEVVP
jgi:hypothetical protein